MPTIATTEAFIVDGVQTTATEQRLYDTAMFLGDGTANGVRGGVVRHGDNSLAVSVNGADQVTIQAGACVIPGAAGEGVWRGTLAAATSAVGLAARNSTNPRIDLVVAQATGTNITFKTIDGTPGASPSPPALPAQHIELARLTVPAVGGGAVTVDSTWRSYATGLGGTLVVETSARLPGSGNQKGQRAVALDTGYEHFWSGTAWLRPGTWVAYTPGVINGAAGTGATLTGKWTQIEITTIVKAKIVLGTGFSFAGGGGFGLTVPVNIATAVLATCTLTDSGTASYMGVPAPQSNYVQMFAMGASGVAVAITATVPFTYTAGDTLEFGITYEPV